IVIILVVLALLAGGLVLVKNQPDNEEEHIDKPNNQTVEYIDVLRVSTDDILKISVSTQESSYTVTKNGSKLTLSDSENIKIDKQALQSLVNSCSYIYAEKLAVEKADDVSLYGFFEPKATISVALKDGVNKVLHIGNQTIDGSGNYIKLSDDDKIYIKNSYSINNLAPEYTAFIDKNILTIDTTDYENLSFISLAKAGNTDIKLEAIAEQNGDSKNILWKMTKPVYADANGVVLSNDILTPLKEFTAGGVAEAKASDLSKYGLTNPYATLTVSAGGETQKFTFGKETDGYRFFRVDNYATVYIAPTENLTFLDVAYIDLMSRIVHLENIKNISTVEIKTSDKNFNLKVSGEERFVNGKKIDKDVFTKVYQNIISISFNSVDINAKPVGSFDVSIKYTRNDNSTCTVSFVSVDDRNYLALVDGKGNGIVTKKSVKDVIDFIEEKYNKIK
ncbi:MAG: DUF4340 domain-containing protein, partial [Clostridia bacterium]|nr:DUF4340 domain-containing protein [Clostridia bacterium]